MKKETLKARGVRLTDLQWVKLEKLAKKNKCTPSDVLRHMIDKYVDEAKK